MSELETQRGHSANMAYLSFVYRARIGIALLSFINGNSLDQHDRHIAELKHVIRDCKQLINLQLTSSFGRESSKLLDFSSHRAPSSTKPWMKAPSRDGAAISSTCFFVTSTCVTVLSSGQSDRRAVVCMTAVRKDCGLNNPESHVTYRLDIRMPYSPLTNQSYLW